MKKKLIYIVYVVFMISYSSFGQIIDKSWIEIINKKEGPWFATEEAKNIAENVLLYQRENGGWTKNNSLQKPLSINEREALKKLKSSNEGTTTDNGATYQEMLFLSKIYRFQPNEKYKESFLKGLHYLLEAQYEYGGWPQFYPLKKGYYSHITFNDDSMANILFLLKEIKDKTNFYSIKPSEDVIQKVAIAFNKGIECILKTQYKQNGILSAWCAQHDTITFQPAKARSYELPSLSGAESAKIVLLLMSIDNPSKEIINAVKSAVNWFEKTKITDLREDKIVNQKGKVINKKMVLDANATPIWARFMELENNTPFFCDRDGVKKYSIEELSEERRNGYAWYKNTPQKVLNEYPKWKKKYDSKKNGDKKNSFEIVVSKDGNGDFITIQDAINNSMSFPYERITIFIKNGIYQEKVKVHEWNPNISLIGESREKTIIRYDDYYDKINVGRNSTFYTSTVLIEADNVILKNLTIENNAGEVGQAIALSVNSDEVAVINCKLIGNQDTLYASGKGKQYYKDCYIEGTTDFIFGNATALFESCEIHSKKDSFITAASTPKEAEFGFVFKNCTLSENENITKVYLGRPWRIYAKTVFINCFLGNHIHPKGWENWSKKEAEKTTLYAEFENTGTGFQPNKRVEWSFQLNHSEAKKYTIKNILGKYNELNKKEWYETL